MKTVNIKAVIATELKVMGESFLRISEALALAEGNEIEVKEEKEVKKAAGQTEKASKVVKEEKKEEEVGADYSMTDLEEMKYNDLKKLAKELGVSPVGTKDAVMAAVAEALNLDADSEDEEEVKPAKSDKKKGALSKNKKKEEPIVEEEDDEEVEDEDEPTLADQVAEELKDLSVEEIAELLTEVGISAKGKRQALIAKVVKAVEEGKIEWDVEEEEEEEVKPAKSTKPSKGKKKEEPVAEEEDEDEEEDDEEEEEVFTKAREESYNELVDELTEAIEGGEISIKEIDKYLADHTTPDDGYTKKMPKDDKIELYIELRANMIDDEGEENEDSSPYYINDEAYCCGHQLKYDEDSDAFICEVCGEEYDNSDDEE